MFPGAGERAVSDARYAILGAPLEISASFYPGARFGPSRIRHFAEGFEDYDHRTDQRFTDLAVIDRGDVRPWQDAEEYLEFLGGELGDVVRAGAIPLLLGGEHTVSIAGVRATDPDVYVCVDAHLDLRASYDGDPWSHATAIHHVHEHVEEVILLGSRSGSRAEWERATASPSITVIEPEEVEEWLQSEWAAHLGSRSAYLSLDIDGIDPGVAPATGTREPFGLRPRTVRSAIAAVGPEAVGFDVVEVTDRDEGQTATLAAKLLRDFVFTHASHT